MITPHYWPRAHPIPITERHPARLWMHRRRLWWPRLAPPPALRWIPAADLPSGHHGAGAIVAAGAPLPSWRAAWPTLPHPTGLMLISLREDGTPCLDGDFSRGGLQTRTLADAHGIVVLGHPLCTHGAALCQDLAAGLTIAARMPETALLEINAGRSPSPDLARDLLSIPRGEGGALTLRIFVPRLAPGRRGPVPQDLRHHLGRHTLRIVREDIDPLSLASRHPLPAQEPPAERPRALSSPDRFAIWEDQRLAALAGGKMAKAAPSRDGLRRAGLVPDQRHPPSFKSVSGFRSEDTI